jgi:polyisoprenoid-binding protein YceI
MTDDSWSAGSAGRPRRRRWGWILTGSIVLIAVVVVAIGLFIRFQPTPSPLALPPATGREPPGTLDGTWNVVGGSVAGFRVQGSFVGFSNDVVGRTSAVTGTVSLSGDHVVGVTFRVGLTSLQVDGKPQRQFAASLDTRDHPDATIRLTQHVKLNHSFTSGSAITTTATGQLTMRGITRPVNVSISARYDGSLVQVAGSIPVSFSPWGITRPAGYGSVATLADHGVAEFLLVLRRQ